MNALENTTTMESQQHHAPTSSRAAKVKSFVWHLFQMAVAMELGMLLYILLRGLLARIGYATVLAEYPLAAYWIMVVFMTLSMIALMRHHRYSWRDCARMTAAMLAPLVALCALALLGLLTIQALHRIGDVTMLLGMAAYMLYRGHGPNHSISQ